MYYYCSLSSVVFKILHTGVSDPDYFHIEVKHG